MGTKTPAEIGEELIRLISETAAVTARSPASVANAISFTTGIDFEIRNGKLNITETALRALDLKMADARARCRELELPHKQVLDAAAMPEPEPIREVAAPPSDPLVQEAHRVGYAIPTTVEEQRIRQKYYKSRGHYRELNHSVWNDLRLATGTNMYSQNEVANFIHGASIREVFAYRLKTTGNIRSSTNGIPGKGGLPRKREIEPNPINLIDAFFSIPWYAWIGGFILIVWLLAKFNVGAGTYQPPPLNAQDQLIKDAATLQLRIDRQERERQEKFEKEYERQRRQGR